ncbi:hypothetical protein KSC_106700 [Ktedonobacter sp. SOSP1-52]|uniref:hypothetical protein n=1 Tax=Ktedonobacter sp. SOSP1-52 TaxID=2778366 RepID=UPI0019160CAF|nr:hypothetical protein [Ktedonobacter sp. SOSP1-52]GHO71778.1 hypothetical protein KSC_106700 [Ktedonobacter sp. SOSP1-52]
MRCRIHLKGHLDPSWQEWLGGLIILQQASGTTLLTGTLPDQAALHGVLVTLRRLNLSLLSLQTDEASQGEESLFFLRENKKKEQK